MVFGIRTEKGGLERRGIQFYRSTGTEEYSFTVLPGRRNKPCMKKPMYQKSHTLNIPVY